MSPWTSCAPRVRGAAHAGPSVRQGPCDSVSHIAGTGSPVPPHTHPHPARSDRQPLLARLRLHPSPQHPALCSFWSSPAWSGLKAAMLRHRGLKKEAAGYVNTAKLLILFGIPWENKRFKHDQEEAEFRHSRCR